MSDEEFLARWSRRKREAETVVDTPPTRPSEAQNPEQSSVTEIPADAEVDLSSLPPIESITGATDITAFLRKGIPAELSRAALRRAWASDPAIRDFVGLAENAWDFNDPNAMPGFGPLDYSAEQLEALVGRIVGSVRSAAESATAVAEEQGHRSVDSGRAPARESRPDAPADLVVPQDSPTDDSPAASVAVQPESPQTDHDDKMLFPRRTHGGALPQ
jgi:uncharacterized protein DUF3306